ncbi:unnamed protein product [Larinioides sclopetarius]|uniref:Uncharacterized protein n=1 Tax=Larinioides sclopetarius TaxID=280406 RepID=A0AAV2B9D5_9ARAC
MDEAERTELLQLIPRDALQYCLKLPFQTRIKEMTCHLESYKKRSDYEYIFLEIISIITCELNDLDFAQLLKELWNLSASFKEDIKRLTKTNRISDLPIRSQDLNLQAITVLDEQSKFYLESMILLSLNQDSITMPYQSRDELILCKYTFKDQNIKSADLGLFDWLVDIQDTLKQNNLYLLSIIKAMLVKIFAVEFHSPAFALCLPGWRLLPRGPMIKLVILSLVYRIAHENVDISDVLGETENKECINNPSDEANNQGRPESKNDKVKDLWISQRFLKPFRCLVNFP